MSTATQELESKALSVPDRAKALTIATDQDFERAGEMLKTIKGLRAEIDETFDPIIGKAHEAHKEALAQKRKVDAPLVEAEAILKPRIAAYMQEQDRIRREQELIAQKKAQEEAERQQLEDAVRLEELGETEWANEVLNEKPVVAPVVLPRTVPKVAGVTMRQTWSAQVISLQLLVKAVAEGKVPLLALQANTTFLNQQARSMKDQLNYPGVKAVPDNNISARR
jgi:hypothetical protein